MLKALLCKQKRINLVCFARHKSDFGTEIWNLLHMRNKTKSIHTFSNLCLAAHLQTSFNSCKTLTLLLYPQDRHNRHYKWKDPLLSQILLTFVSWIKQSNQEQYCLLRSSSCKKVAILNREVICSATKRFFPDSCLHSLPRFGERKYIFALKCENR